ncbi:hypothetical protein [Cellulomonas fimi]|uniref:hypothetical protein n=1 Tax=Cellulomonas fimi TaxID=1708 RepID=UPI0002D93597|nr:hypothetical protein [Cellulomonas fimi]NNH07944.1 hypothetical protein [Cellulomonas fimi]VEH36510.1 Uncharacterised protein [Cellulomonas fimi]
MPDQPPAPASTLEDHQELLLSWASTANTLDEFPLAEQLLAAAETEETPGIALHRARLLAYQGRHAEALALLPDIDVKGVVSRGPETVADLVALAATAGLGDDAALAALVRAGTVVRGPIGITHLYLLGAAAESRGRFDLADAAWQELGRTDAPRTQLSVGRLVVARVAGRGDEAQEAFAAVLDAGQAVIREWPTPDDDLWLARDSADRVAARGDALGAALLVRMVSRLAPGTTALAALLPEHPLHVRRLRYWLVPILVWPLALALAVVTVAMMWHPALLLLAAVLMLGATFVRLPSVVGASDADEHVWRSLGAAPAELENNHVAFRRGATRFALVGTGLVGAGVGTVAGGLLMESTTVDEAQPTAMALVWMLLVVAGAVGGAVLGWRLRLRMRARVHAERRAADLAREAAALKDCRCWKQSSLRSISADAYERQHLQPATVDLPALPVHEAHALECPLTGVRWLSTRTRPDAAGLLLRGTSPRPPEEEQGAEPDQGTGMYL